MTVFDVAVRALFADPNIAETALWRQAGAGAGLPVAVIRVRPAQEFDIGGAKLVNDAILFDVSAGMAPTIDENDTIETGGTIYTVQAPPIRTMDSRIWRLDVRPA